MRMTWMIGALALAACVQQETVVDGRAAFLENCAACHGTDGRGDGPLAGSLDKQPANLTTLSQRHGGVFPADYVMSTIDGFRRGSHFSKAMPEFGAGDMGATVMVGSTPIPARLLALSNYLQTIQQ